MQHPFYLLPFVMASAPSSQGYLWLPVRKDRRLCHRMYASMQQQTEMFFHGFSGNHAVFIIPSESNRILESVPSNLIFPMPGKYSLFPNYYVHFISFLV